MTGYGRSSLIGENRPGQSFALPNPILTLVIRPERPSPHKGLFTDTITPGIDSASLSPTADSTMGRFDRPARRDSGDGQWNPSLLTIPCLPSPRVDTSAGPLLPACHRQCVALRWRSLH